MEQSGLLQGVLGSSLASSLLKSCKFSFQPIKHGLFWYLSLKVITIPFLLFSKRNKRRHFPVSTERQSTNSLVETLKTHTYTYTYTNGITSIHWHATNRKPDHSFACPIFSLWNAVTCIFIDETNILPMCIYRWNIDKSSCVF